MAMLPFKPTPFFANKNRAFWMLHIAGWTGALLLRAISGFVGGQDSAFLIIIAIEAVTGFSISLVLAVIFQRLFRLKPIVTWVSTALVLASGVALFTFIETWIISIIRPSFDGNFAALFISFIVWPLTLLGGWSALYFAINFFLQVEEQADRLIRLENQATSAQLAMLRYQLNPHFLFNTLNSISTLVLLKQTEPANAMLTRLSSFLRHTLETEPGGKVTLSQEIETLKLYLDIERMRFEERLRTEFHVDPRAAEACLPSMLLQPLIENAIKYAVGAQEEGARISLSAQLVGNRLRVSVSDTGPGLDTDTGPRSLPASITTSNLAGSSRHDSTGVGLANIRDRLAQAYGDDHLFEIRSPPDGGFTVIIELPYDTAESDNPALSRAALPANSGRASIEPRQSSPDPVADLRGTPFSAQTNAPAAPTVRTMEPKT
ncbi:MAG: histidine kinase [Alteripontixanthobacter sp.]